jgi:hypothetical protein
MPDFTVFEGGGKGRPPEDFDALMAQDALQMLAIEILRAMVRGDEADGRITRNLAKFCEHVSKTRIDLGEIVNEAIRALHQRLKREHDPLSLSIHIDRIISASLRIAAEGCCRDNAAAGRRSGREGELFAAIEGFNRWHEPPKQK